MASETFERLHRPEGAIGPAQQFSGGDVAEIVRDQVRQQRHAHVGGGGARASMEDGYSW